MTGRSLQLACVLISGFRQERHGSHGLAHLHRSLIERYHDRRTSFVALEDWRTRPSVLGDKIAHNAGSQTPIVIVSYSWGGPTAAAVIRRIAEHGKVVALWIAIDPVVRWSQTWWSPRNLIALTRLGALARPDNVDRVHLHRQLNDRPAGREITDLWAKAGDRRTVYGSADRLYGIHGTHVADPSVTHNSIDDDPRVHSSALSSIERLAPLNGRNQV